MVDSNDKKVNLESDSTFRADMTKVIQNISDFAVLNKHLKKNEPVPPDVVKRVMHLTLESKLDDEMRTAIVRENKIKRPTDQLVQKTYSRFVKYDYGDIYKPIEHRKFNNEKKPMDFSCLILAAYEYMMNFDTSEIKRDLQYYEKSYSYITHFVEGNYNRKGQKLFKHYQRAALATYIVVELGLVIPPKGKPSSGYTNENLVEISKNALKPIIKRF